MSLNDGALFAETGCEAISTPCFIFGFCTPDKFVPLVSKLVIPELLLSFNELGIFVFTFDGVNVLDLQQNYYFHLLVVDQQV